MSSIKTHEKHSPTEVFFAELEDSPHQTLLKDTSGTIRLDLADGNHVDHWLINIDQGNVRLSRDDKDADAVLRLDKATFDGMAMGKMNAMAATLRGDLDVEGDLALAMLFQRLLPAHHYENSR